MRSQARTYISTGRSLRRGPSRCQKLWQGILIVATLALAMAASSARAAASVGAPRCVEIFATASVTLKESKSATIHYKFGRMTNELLQQPDVRSDVLHSIERDLVHLKLADQTLVEKIDALAKKSATASRESQMQIFQSEISKNEFEFSQLRSMARAVEHGRGLNAADLQLIGSRIFSENLSYGKKSDLKSFTARLKELDRRGALVENTRIPPTRIQRIFRLKLRTKIIAVIMVANIMYGGYDLYSASHDQSANENIQTVLVYE